MSTKSTAGGGLFLRLNTISNARRSLARVVRLYARDMVEDRKYRGLVFGFAQLIAAFKTEHEIETFSARLDALENWRSENERAK